MKNSICVVTSCTGLRDTLIEDQVVDGTRFIAYVDKFTSGTVWEQRKAYENFVSPRRNSRIHKILIHQYVDTNYSLWIDANIKLLVPVERLVDDWLGAHDIAIFKHRLRDCVYDEAEICAELRLDEPRVIREQVQSYADRGFARGQGLAEACVILRRHNAKVIHFNNAWWSEYSRHSVRDQIGLMVAAKEVGIALNLITPTRFDHPYFHCEPRPPGIENEVDLPSNVMEIC